MVNLKFMYKVKISLSISASPRQSRRKNLNILRNVSINRPFFINHLGLTRAKKCAIVVRLTPHGSANFRCETPMSRCCKI